MLLLCRRGLLGLLALAVLPALLWAEQTPQQRKQTEARLKRDVTFLASDKCEGRGPNTDGIELAADYVADQFKKAGLKPGNGKSWFQPFRIAGAKGSLTLKGPQDQRIRLQQRKHFLPLGYDQSGTVSAPVAFAGYGLSTATYDDYEGFDAKGKVLVILRDTPRPGSANRPRDWQVGAAFVTKLKLAREKGAKAVLFINDADTAEDSDGLADFSYTRLGGDGKRLPALFCRRDVFEKMLPASKSLRGIERGIDANLKPNSFNLRGWSVSLEVERKSDAIELKNVVGVLEGNGPLANETVVVGAHYDHLGYGGPASMSRSKKRQIHHGADDNGSGTTSVMELARRFAAIKDRKGRRLVFMAFSGEELGLYGSAYYCNHPLFPLEQTAAMYNLDMVGRLRKTDSGKWKLLTEGHGTAKPFKKLIDELADKYDLALKSQASGYGPSDHASFCGKKVPVLFVWTDYHSDYHRPSDTADKINVPGMRRIVDMSEDAVRTLTTMEKPVFTDVRGSNVARPSSGPRLGIRPGYGSDKEGVEVDAVTSGSPAHKGGIKSGDVIVGLAGKPVKDLKTYMVAMGGQKKGNTIEVDVVRKGKKVTLKVKLE